MVVWVGGLVEVADEPAPPPRSGQHGTAATAAPPAWGVEPRECVVRMATSSPVGGITTPAMLPAEVLADPFPGAPESVSARHGVQGPYRTGPVLVGRMTPGFEALESVGGASEPLGRRRRLGSAIEMIVIVSTVRPADRGRPQRHCGAGDVDGKVARMGRGVLRGSSSGAAPRCVAAT